MNNPSPVTIRDLFDCRVPYLKDFFDAHRYPWELLPLIRALAENLLREPPVGFHLLAPGILVGEDVSVAPTATLIGPAIFGAHTEIRPGAYIRGGVITGAHCVIGNSTELKNCVLLDHVQVPHYNYVGDSILGSYAHMGASAICSNLKADGTDVVVRCRTDGTSYETGLRKFGAVLGDHADVGCGSVLNPGTVIGMRTSVYPLVSVRGVIPADSIVKSAEITVARRKEL